MEEILSHRYPKELTVGEGDRKKTVSIRPLEPKDEQKLIDYFKRLPADERALLKDDVSDESVIRNWCRNIDYMVVLPIVAFDGDKIVSDCTLHQDRRGWQSHIGRVRISTDPEYRGLGLSKAIVKEFCEISPDIGLTILDAEVMDVQNKAIDLFQELGFNQSAILSDHVIDRKGNVHDLVIMSMPVVIDNPEAID